MSSKLPSLVLLAASLSSSLVLAQKVGFSSNNQSEVQLGLLRYNGGNWNPRPRGLVRLAWETRKRTSIDMALEVAEAKLLRGSLFSSPLVFWLGDSAFPPFSEQETILLRQFLATGGTLVIDAADGLADGPFLRSVNRELAKILPENKPVRLPDEHVVYKSFFLANRHGGRVLTQAFLKGIFIEDRLAVIISANDMMGAMAQDDFGLWEYAVGEGGEATRESTFRLGINIIMYALCLNYKEDQVHIPFILKRRR